VWHKETAKPHMFLIDRDSHTCHFNPCTQRHLPCLAFLNTASKELEENKLLDMPLNFCRMAAVACVPSSFA
jgi:hypothetical protein